jgi:hypothetical protein
MKLFHFTIVLIVCFVLGLSNTTYSQDDDVYDEGTVWSLTFVRTGANVAEDYLKDISKTWKAFMDGAVKEGLVLSYKILIGPPANEDDFNIVLMIENKNMASLDPDPERDAKFDAMEEKIKESMKGKYDETVTNYENLRQIYGTKVMREIFLK